MVISKGKSVFGGIAIGKIALFHKEEQSVKRSHIDNVSVELKRFFDAKETAISELKLLYDKAMKEVGQVNAMIFEVHQMMLDDLDYLESITHKIENDMVNAEYSVACASDIFQEMFRGMEDPYMQERAADVSDVSERIIRILQGKTQHEMNKEEPVILVANDLAPSETVQLDKEKVLAFVTRFGSTNSHTAILARTMNIPALISVDYTEDMNGKLGVVDGFEGILYVEPDEITLRQLKEKKEQVEKQRELLLELKGKETVTADGKKINLYANIGAIEDTFQVLKNDAGGIGLFRSEFLYLEKNDYPSEEEQFKAYKTVVERMAGKKVIIRTLDIGADKQAGYFNIEQEENPAMGYRAIRICLDRKDIFKTQLRALYRASNYGNLSIMYPMIISVSEVLEIKKIVAKVKAELKEQGIPYEDVEEGIMIETPAAVMISDLLAKEVDFFSIGTNDLTQYTLAIDRQNPKLDSIYDSHHPAVLRMIQMVIVNGHKESCWVGICGELGADITLTEEFVKMGIDELSVSPNMILPIRKRIREISLV